MGGGGSSPPSHFIGMRDGLARAFQARTSSSSARLAWAVIIGKMPPSRW